MSLDSETQLRYGNNLDAYWMPFTANRQFKSEPRMVVGAEGMYYLKDDGARVLDGSAGMWCCNAGHCPPEIVAAVRAQVGVLDYAPAFQMGHPKIFELAARLTQLAPPAFTRAFFTNSGSEAADTALKIALAYHQIRGDGGRTRLIGRARGYHGVGFGGLSVGGLSANKRMFGSLLAGVDHLPHTYDHAHMAFSRGQPAWGAHLADELENLVALHDASTIAAVIVEPVAGSTGVLVPPRGYLERLREITERHGILLIFDEVITGFGRLGAPFAAQYFNINPDIITLAKGLTSGVVPMGGVLVGEGIYETFMNGASDGIEFFHGYTYSGHPLAAAAGVAALDYYQHHRLFDRAADLAPVFEDAVHGLRDVRHVIDIRNLGLMAAVELGSRSGAPGARGFDAFLACYDAGLYCRVTGDTLAFSPPLIISEEEIHQMFSIVARVLEGLA